MALSRDRGSLSNGNDYQADFAAGLCTGIVLTSLLFGILGMVVFG